jgi:hypothetical protein
VGDDAPGAARLEDPVSAGVVAVEVGVDDQVDRPAARFALEPVQADLRRVRELRVDDEDRVLADVGTDGAALAVEDADPAADVRERGLRRSWGGLLRGGGLSEKPGRRPGPGE